jgi:hypothetical protein
MGSGTSGKSFSQSGAALARKNQSSRAEREHPEDGCHHQHEAYAG